MGGQVRLKNTLNLLLCVTALASSAAHASDIQCATTRQPAERVICDHAILDNEYDDIMAQQQAMMSAGRLSAAQLMQWRQARNACTDVHCIDTVFAQWKATARSIDASTAAQAPVMASSTALAPVGPTSDANANAYPASDATAASSAAEPTSEASLVRQGSAAGVALPQPVESTASASMGASAPSGSSGASSHSDSMLGLPVILLLAVAVGALVWRRNRGGRRR